MAPIESSPSNARALAAWPNALAAAYVGLVFIALRALDDTARLVVLGLAGLTFAAMIAGRLRGRLSADADGKKLLLLVGGPADALLLVGGALCAWFTLAEDAGGDNGALVVGVGVLALVAGAGITLALELVAGPMRATGTIDNRRVQTAARTAATLVLALAAVAALCFGVEKLDVRRDFSFAAPTSPSQATLSMLEASSCPALVPGSAGDDAAPPPEAASSAPAGPGGKAEVFLFFERGSTALGEVRDYFDALQAKGARVVVLDAAFDPTLAKEMKASKNGTVGFRCGKRTESWTLGDTREDAQKKLNKLDEEVRTRLAKISKDPVNVYFTVGHGERSLDEAAKGGARTAAKGLKKLIESLNAKAKKLGIAEGLTKEVPADAALVVLPGPTSAFLPEEAEALARWVQGGGSIMVLLDPKLPGSEHDVHASLEPLFAALAVRVGSHEVMNDKAYVKNTNTAADYAFLYSTSFGNHKSVKTLSGARGKAALLFMGAGSVDKRDAATPPAGAAAAKPPKVSLIARTPAQSWVDTNDDRKFDEGQEARAVVDLAAAVEVPAATEGGREGRALVVGDSDVVADAIVAQDANSMFAYESLLWLLRDDEKLGGSVVSEEDVAIRHTRDEDTLWFYGTILFGPVMCLIGGLVFVARKRTRRKRAEPAGPAARSNGGAA